MRTVKIIFVAIALVLCCGKSAGEESHLTAKDAYHTVEGDADLPTNKFTARGEIHLKRSSGDRAAKNIREELFGVDLVTNNNGTCDHGVHLLWTTQVGSSIFATPRIVDLHSDGKKEILVPTYTQYVEAIDGITGEDVQGFPFAHPHFKSHSSPLPVDLNSDGILEWMIATYTGELMFLQEDGTVVKTIKIPPLPLKRDWKKAANGNHSKAEKSMDPVVLNPFLRREIELMLKRKAAASPQKPLGSGNVRGPMVTDGPVPRPMTFERKLAQQDTLEVPTSDPSSPHGAEDSSAPVEDHNAHDSHAYESYNAEELRDLYGEDPYEDGGDDEKDEMGNAPATIGVDGWLSTEAKASMDLLFHPELYESSVNVDWEKDPFHHNNLDSDNVVIVTSDEVAVDAHILSTPVVADLDGDGTLDALVHVSYFFDQEYYSKAENMGSLPEDINMDDYVADALLCISLVTGKVKWLQLMHLTTKTVAQPAYGFSTPLVININGDFLFDVFVTTAIGYIFGFDGRGNRLQGWPVHMAPIIGGCIAEDVNADGNVDICAGDIKGTIACFHGDGREIWERQCAGSITDTPTAGDINGDGFVDIVFGTSAGGIYAVDGRHGGVLPHFPILTGGPVLSSVLLMNMNNSNPPALLDASRGLHAIVPSHDGYLYIISGTTGCYEVVDLGEKAFGMVLADDLTGNGLMDLVVTTLSGTVMAYSTETPFHPLKSWTSRTKALNGATASENYVGVFIEPESRAPRDIRGDRFKLLVTIRDERPGKHKTFTPRYIITVLIGTKIIVFNGMFLEAKTYALELHAPMERLYGTIRVVLSLPNGQHFEDYAAMSFNMHFMETIKFLLLGPFLLVVLALSFVTKDHTLKPIVYRVYRRRNPYEDDY